MAISSQGTTFTFAGTPYTVTSISVSFGEGSGSGSGSGNQRQRVSAAYLDSDPNQAEPYFEIWQPDPAGGGRLTSGGGTAGTSVSSTVEIEFLGISAPAYDSVGTLVIAGPVSMTFSNATCKSSTIRLAVGDVVRGSASFNVKAS
jgi:hypothetical protein